MHRLPKNVIFRQKSNVEHAFSCKKGGFITIRNDELRQNTTHLLKIIYDDVKIELLVLLFSRESFWKRTANSQAKAWIDLSVKGIFFLA